MSLVSIPLKNDIANQRDIFRLAATMYAHTSDAYSTTEAQLQMIVCLFVDDENKGKNCSEIIVALLSVYKYHISEDELISIIKRNKKIFQTSVLDNQEVFSLSEDAYCQANELQKNNIDFYISEFISANNIIDVDACRNAIYKYLYELTTTNINSYRVLLFGKTEESFSESELSVDLAELTDWEIKTVHDFLEWEDDAKNLALGNIVYCCLEYCLLVNGDSPNKLLLKEIRKRKVYLDTNVIFRALGINGFSRQKVVTAFLDKCKQANISLVVSSHTKQEFQTTIQHYIEQISNFPHGDIYLGAYESLTDYTIFSFYDDWRRKHKGLSLKYFSSYINSLYKKLMAQYNILDDERIPSEIYDSDEFKVSRNAYSTAIKSKKQEAKYYYYDYYDGYTRSSSHDATLVHYVEILRQRSDNEDIFFVSSDKVLRFWDMTRPNHKYPVVIYPSQLFLILIKLYGRSQNDYDSFVSFINIRTKSQQLSPETANIILSGISSITEDIKNQEYLVSAIFNDEFQNIIHHSNTDLELYQDVQSYSQNYLDEQLKRKDAEIKAISEESAQKDVQISELKKERDSKIEEKEKAIRNNINDIEARKERITTFAEKKTLPRFALRWYILPTVVILLWLTYVCFVALQFLWYDAPWNLATKYLGVIGSTWFGKYVDGYPAIIDGAIFVVLCTITPFLWKKFWDADARNVDKANRIEKYLKKNNLS